MIGTNSVFFHDKDIAYSNTFKYTVRHKLSIASIDSLKNEGSFPVMNFLFILFIRIDKLVTVYS